ncbi:MAG: glycosyltransferase [Pantoea sp.]|uniref:glycosyltransferase n=1 Tax=Pantoea sp. TaxID=69393 RepID=UPI0039E5BB47
MKILVSGEGYPEKRNIIVSGDNCYLNFRKKNIYLYINAFRQKLLKKNKIFLFRIFPGLSPGDSSVIHIFNEVAQSGTKWISTFETELPRVLPVKGMIKTENPELHRLLDYVAAPECIRIIAISDATSRIQMKLLESFPHYRDVIGRKICVMHPPQPILYPEERSFSGKRVTFTFIGNEFYRKGGAEVVLAFSELHEEGLIGSESVQVNLIGDLSRKHNIALRNFQDEEKFNVSIENLIHAHSFFRHFNFIPNDRVIELLKETDVGLLPTWQDTYGFSVLEMQACGCPVITTNIRALPEINPISAGWIIECPLNDMYEHTVDSESAKQNIRKAVIAQMKTHIMNAVRDPHGIKRRSDNALRRIHDDHNPEVFSQKLNEIYLSA